MTKPEGGNGVIAAVRELRSQANGIRIWLCDLDRLAVEAIELSSVLSSQEHARAARFGNALLRYRWIAGRSTLRSLLGAAIGESPASVRLRRGARGRPELEGKYGIDFNVSHTHGVAIMAIAMGIRDGARIGVDIEFEQRQVNASGLGRKFLTERERGEIAPEGTDAHRRKFLELWTCKEAMSKATGDALSAPFRQLDVTLNNGRRVLSGPEPYSPDAWQLVIVDAAPELIATLAIWQPRQEKLS